MDVDLSGQENQNEWLKELLEQEPCEDCISRQAVIDLIGHYNSDGLGSVFYGYDEGVKFANAVNKLPSVTLQEPKTGHWIQINEFFINSEGQFVYKFICSECKSISYFRKSNKKAIGADVCPNCGAKMEDII